MAESAPYLPRRRLRAALRFAASPGWSRRVGIAGVATIAILCFAGPLLSPYGPTELNVALGPQGPSWHHLFGTDQIGEDVFTRVLYGGRVDLAIGFVGVTVPLVVGSIIGLLAGYYGRWLDVVVGRIVDVFTAFPYLVLVIAIVAMLGAGLRNLFIAILVVSWVSYARIVRAETLTSKHREYVLAARALGYSNTRIMFRHLLPNVISPAIVFSMSDFVLDILAAAALGFFGLGVQPPQPEWGVMIANGRDLLSAAPWLVLFPGLAIVVVGFFFSLLGDGTADYIRRLDGRS
jgi:peptide/nickel transport system permease protein